MLVGPWKGDSRNQQSDATSSKSWPLHLSFGWPPSIHLPTIPHPAPNSPSIPYPSPSPPPHIHPASIPRVGQHGRNRAPACQRTPTSNRRTPHSPSYLRLTPLLAYVVVSAPLLKYGGGGGAIWFHFQRSSMWGNADKYGWAVRLRRMPCVPKQSLWVAAHSWSGCSGKEIFSKLFGGEHIYNYFYQTKELTIFCRRKKRIESVRYGFWGPLLLCLIVHVASDFLLSIMPQVLLYLNDYVPFKDGYRYEEDCVESI